MADVGRASIEVVGDVRNFARQVEKDLNAALKKIKINPIDVPVDHQQAMRAGEEVGYSFGSGVREGAQGQLREARRDFDREGEKLGRNLGDGVNRGFGRDTFNRLRKTLSDGL